MDLPEEAKRAPSAPVWNQSFSSSKALFVRGTFFIRWYPLVHSRGRSPIRNLGTRVAAVVPQLASGTATATATTYWSSNYNDNKSHFPTLRSPCPLSVFQTWKCLGLFGNSAFSYLHCSFSLSSETEKQTSVARINLPNLSQLLATALLSELHWLPVTSRITFELAWVSKLNI